MYDLIQYLVDEDLDCTCGFVTLDFDRLQRIGAGGVAVLSNLVELMRKSGVIVSCDNITPKCKAYKQLRDFGFMEKYVAGGIAPERTVWRLPLSIVHEEKIYSYITSHLIPWIAGAFETEEDLLSSVTVSMQEIFNNIVDHSTVKIGCACAEFSRTHGIVRICISDFGIGIPRQVRKALPDIGRDARAIAKACEHGFTTQSTPRNRGAGLHVLIKSIVGINSGNMSIYSNCGIYSVRKSEGRMKTSVRSSKGFYPGTMFFITLSAKDFVPPVREERFQW
ncbi:MAG: hypothetical protein WBA83_13695 [Burkholderiaceae bacterium]